jgi:Na+-translocating ferredoxin:NAD+ oxidoreductase subunit A
MNNFVRMLLTALMAVTTENIIFSGGIGFSHVLRAARKPRTLGLYSIFIIVFSLISILLGALLVPILPVSDRMIFLRPVILAVCVAAVYSMAAYGLNFFLPQFYKKQNQILSSAAINTVILSMPYVQKSFKLCLSDAAAFAVGTGVAFFLAASVLTHAVARFESDDMPRAFRGLPAVLLYIGILSLAFAGFTGGKLF